MGAYSMDSGMKLFVEGNEIFLSTAVINELHRQENIQWGKYILVNYSEEVIGKPYEAITDDEFEAYAEELEQNMLYDNGELEEQAIKAIFT